MKRLLAFVLTTLMMLSCASPAMAKAEIRAARDEFPDVNMDGELNIDDARAILRYVVGLYSVSQIDPVAADRDQDGMITSYDAYLLILWLRENGYLDCGRASRLRAAPRTNYNPPEAVAESPFIATFHPDQPTVDIDYVSRNLPTNGLISIVWDKDVTSVDGVGEYNDYLAEYYMDVEKGVIHAAYALLNEAGLRTNTIARVGFWLPEEDTEFVCRVYQRNQFLNLNRSYRVFVEGQ